MQKPELLPHLFRTEYRKMVAVLSRLFGIEHIEIAEDMVSDTFLLAAETWGLKGLPSNPTAWLYAISKNKAIDFLRRKKLFSDKISTEILHSEAKSNELKLEFTDQNITDSQLQMMFAICHPAIPAEAQIGLSLSILCGFGVEEIADAFLTGKEAIYKRLARAKEKLKKEQVRIEFPPQNEIDSRLETVHTTIYLLFSEGYYSNSHNKTLRKDLCLEAMRLNLMLVENAATNTPPANALLSLMCFHASRFEARTNANDEVVLYQDQDEANWSKELIDKGEYYLNRASKGNRLSKYHLEAAIAYWHTQKKDTQEKWENILQFYNRLLIVEYSPIAALNRTYALSKANGNEEAIIEAEKLNLKDNHLYHTLLGNLYSGIDNEKAAAHMETAFSLARTEADKKLIRKKMEEIRSSE